MSIETKIASISKVIKRKIDKKIGNDTESKSSLFKDTKFICIVCNRREFTKCFVPKKKEKIVFHDYYKEVNIK